MVKNDKSIRSHIMAQIKSKNTRIEILIRRKLWKLNCRYRIHTSLFGKPDLSNKSKKTVVFIDSCFWHGCNLHFRPPQTNLIYWQKKIKYNRLRDIEVSRYYIKNKWNVIRIWEHDLKNDVSLERKIKQVFNLLRI